MTLLRRLVLTAVLTCSVVLAGCAEAENPQPQAKFPDEGLQATGRLGGQRVAVSSGNPDVTRGDCDPADGLDEDLCMVVRTIDGQQINIVIENPAALEADQAIDVRPANCNGADCDEVADAAIVDVRVGGEQTRALSGRITPSAVTDNRVAADFRFNLPGGNQLVGSFNVLP